MVPSTVAKTVPSTRTIRKGGLSAASAVGTRNGKGSVSAAKAVETHQGKGSVSR